MKNPNGSDIPQARELLVKALQFKEWARVEEALALLRRATAVRRAPEESAKVTARVAEKIRAFAVANPNMPLQEIAVWFHTNSGRVSEALHGLR